jgi:sulfur-oxidizing protein SoxX
MTRQNDAVRGAVRGNSRRCATAPSDERISAEANAMIKASFKARPGGARSARPGRYAEAVQPGRRQDPAEGCRRPDRKTKSGDDQISGRRQVDRRLEKWRKDRPGRPRQAILGRSRGPVGGNCYACHQLAPQELAYGTIGPSLYRFGKLRGYGVETQRYAYGKIFNSEAFAACSTMPRFGHNGILSEQQIKDVTALLMDPASPVNQ